MMNDIRHPLIGKRRKSARSAFTAAFISIMAYFLLFVVHVFVNAAEWKARVFWDRVPFTVVDVTPTADNPKNLRVDYSYVHQELRYGDAIFRKEHEVLYLPGSRGYCWVNPANPSESLPDRVHRDLEAVVSIAFVCLAGGWFLTGIRRLKLHKRKDEG